MIKSSELTYRPAVRRRRSTSLKASRGQSHRLLRAQPAKQGVRRKGWTMRNRAAHHWWMRRTERPHKQRPGGRLVDELRRDSRETDGKRIAKPQRLTWRKLSWTKWMKLMRWMRLTKLMLPIAALQTKNLNRRPMSQLPTAVAMTSPRSSAGVADAKLPILVEPNHPEPMHLLVKTQL